MATRSTIWAKQEDGLYKGIYCHFDGYPSGVGATLNDHYNTEEAVQSLIALGDISSLGDKLTPTEGSGHSFDTPEEEVTVAYHRDRGERLNQWEAYSVKGAINKSSGVDYVYVWEDNCWTCTKMYDDYDD